jgi:hypothetical protein
VQKKPCLLNIDVQISLDHGLEGLQLNRSCITSVGTYDRCYSRRNVSSDHSVREVLRHIVVSGKRVQALRRHDEKTFLLSRKVPQGYHRSGLEVLPGFHSSFLLFVFCSLAPVP